MGRISYNITEENRRRLELLKAFSSINNNHLTICDMVNQAIELYYVHAYETFADDNPNDMLKAAMESVLPPKDPQECEPSAIMPDSC